MFLSCLLLLGVVVFSCGAIHIDDSTTLTKKAVLIGSFVFQEGGTADITILEISPTPTDPTSLLFAICLSSVIDALPTHLDEDTQCTKIKNVCDIIPFNASMLHTISVKGSYDLFFLLCAIPNYLKITYHIHLLNPTSELSADEMYRPRYFLVLLVAHLVLLLFFCLANAVAPKHLGRLQGILFLINMCFLVACVFRAIFWHKYASAGVQDDWLGIVATLFVGLGSVAYVVLMTFLVQGYQLVFQRTPLLQVKLVLLIVASFALLLFTGVFYNPIFRVGGCVVLLVLVPLLVRAVLFNVKVVKILFLVNRGVSISTFTTKRILLYAALCLFGVFVIRECLSSLLAFVTWTKLFSDLVQDTTLLLLLALTTATFRAHPTLHPIEVERNVFLQTQNRQLHFLASSPRVFPPVDQSLSNSLLSGTLLLYILPTSPLGRPPPKGSPEPPALGLASLVYNSSL